MTILDRDPEIDALLEDLTKARNKCEKSDPVWVEFDKHIDTVLGRWHNVESLEACK